MRLSVEYFKNSRASGTVLYGAGPFNDLLRVEERKTERSENAFLLMLIGLELIDPKKKKEAERQIASALFSATRESDVKGWYREGSVIGVIFADQNRDGPISSFQELIFEKVCDCIRNGTGSDTFDNLRMELRVSRGTFSRRDLTLLEAEGGPRSPRFFTHPSTMIFH